MENDLPHISEPLKVISGCRILSSAYNPHLQHDIHVSDDGKISSITRHTPKHGDPRAIDANNRLLTPSLCHSHIHLDKCFLLSDPKFAHLEIAKGDFAEAMELTLKAKETFEREDLVRRGKWLIAESIAAGVTHMRAFVEVDHAVGFKCLEAAVELKTSFVNACKIQICAFAQDPIYSGPHGEENRGLMEKAICKEEVEVVGSTPYVEDSEQNMHRNIRWAVENALYHKKHLDLHLDYNLDRDKKPLIYLVLDTLNHLKWPHNGDVLVHPTKTICIGHCTRLTLLSPKEWNDLSDMVRDLPLHFIGLPTSDLFIQGKPLSEDGGGERPRGTLQIPQMIGKYGMHGCIAINNVGNAFTPYGSCDPLGIASMGVGLYHAGTKDDAQLLFDCVSGRAKETIGYPGQDLVVGSEANFVLFDMGGGKGEKLSKQRGTKTMQEIVYDPPKERRTIFKGRIVDV